MFSSTLIVASLVMLWYMLAFFVVAQAKRNNSIVDIAWGPGALLVALAALWWQRPSGMLPLLSTALVALWAVRLSVHIALRNWGRGEDWRYAAWRGAWGQWFVLRSFFSVFVLQGVLLLIVAVPVLWMNTFGGSVSWLVVVGAGVWVIGFFLEMIADHQLTHLKKDPAHQGAVLQSGLWKYSRHPNYFGEMLLWWGIWLMACSTAGGWLTILGPLTITFLLVRVSGVPMLEARLMQLPAFVDYAKRTSALIPWFPK